MGSNLSNLRIDNDTYSSTVHTVNIQDDDPTPQLAFSSNTAITATCRTESVTTPTIKVIIIDGSIHLL